MKSLVRRGRAAGLAAGAIGTALAAGVSAAEANFVGPYWAVALGGGAGGVALYSGWAWQRRQEVRQAQREWQAAITPGPAGSGPSDAAAQTDSVLAALNPDREIIPFSPLRGPHLRELLRWCDQPNQGPVWRVTGTAGTGKTRLLLEATHRLERDGWTCGWVRRGKTVDAVAAAGLQRGRVLLIVDDADTMADHPELADALTALVRRDQANDTRLVLSGRDFGGWWSTLRAGLDPAVHAAVTSSGPTRLTALTVDPAPQQQMFTAAARQYARHFNRPVPTVTLTGLVAGTTYAELHAAAAAAAQQTLTGTLSLDRALQQLFTIEESWWQANAAEADLSHPLPVLRAAVTAATLIGADSCEQTTRRLACLPGLMSTSPERLTELALWLHQLYAQRGGEWLDPHLPARLAERYAARCTAAQPALPVALATAALTT